MIPTNKYFSGTLYNDESNNKSYSKMNNSKNNFSEYLENHGNTRKMIKRLNSKTMLNYFRQQKTLLNNVSSFETLKERNKLLNKAKNYTPQPMYLFLPESKPNIIDKLDDPENPNERSEFEMSNQVFAEIESSVQSDIKNKIKLIMDVNKKTPTNSSPHNKINDKLQIATSSKANVMVKTCNSNFETFLKDRNLDQLINKKSPRPNLKGFVNSRENSINNSKVKNYIYDHVVTNNIEIDMTIKEGNLVLNNKKLIRPKALKMGTSWNKLSINTMQNLTPASSYYKDTSTTSANRNIIENNQKYQYRGFQPIAQQKMNTNDRCYKNPKYWALNYLNSEVTSDRDFLNKKNKGKLLESRQSMCDFKNLRNMMDLNQEVGSNDIYKKAHMNSKCLKEDLVSWNGDQISELSFTEL